MARILRKTQKIFALSAANNGVFGSAQDNTKILSNDVEVLQSKPAWGTGWLDAIIGARKFPPLEEFQGIQYVATSQLAYLFQEGIPEWDDGTTYYQKSIVRQTGTYQLYGSLVDNNLNNALTDATKWVPLADLSATVPQATTSVYGTTRLADSADLVVGSTSTDTVTAAQFVAGAFNTGDLKHTTRKTLTPGFVWGSGRTIGNAASNATERANADTFALFEQIWTDYPYAGATAAYNNGERQVYTSAGAAVARGASAAADFAANRQIKIHDIRGLAVVGADNMGGTAAGRLSGQPGGLNGQIIGAIGGLETHSLTAAQNGPHTHPGGESDIQNLIGGSSGAFVRLNTQPESNTGSSGNGDPHNNVQPSTVYNIMIKL